MRLPAPWRASRWTTCSRCSKWRSSGKNRNGRARRDELHRRRQPTLHDTDVAGVEPAMEAVDVAVQLGAAAGVRVAGSMRGPQTATMRRPGTSARAAGSAARTASQQMRADARAAHGDEADLFVLTPAELAPQRRALGGGRRLEAGDVAAELEVRLDPRPYLAAVPARSGRRRRRRARRRRSRGRARADSARSARASRRCSRPSGRPRARRPRAAAGSRRSRSARRRARS